MRKRDFKRLEDYRIIGDLYTCALIGKDGSIAWLCLPHVESPSVFDALLDIEKGGCCSVEPLNPYKSSQRYVKNTNILETAFSTDTGEAVLTDFMPQNDTDEPEKISQVIFREISCFKGIIDFDAEFSPRFDYARVKTIMRATETGIMAKGKRSKLFLYEFPAREDWERRI